MNPLERLRQKKAKALNSMQELNNLAAAEKRELSAEERSKYEALKSEAEKCDVDIALVNEALSGIQGLAAPLQPDTEALRSAEDKARKAEQLRQKTIRGRVAVAGLSAEFAETLCGGELADAEVTSAIFEEMAKASAGQPKTKPNVQMQHDEGDKIRETMGASLLHRYEPVLYKAEGQTGRQWIGLSLMDLARECLRRKGVDAGGRGTSDTVMLALTTSDFPGILLDVANKTLRAGYTNYPNTFQQFARRTTATDFKPHYSVQMSGAPSLLKVEDDGEIKQGALSDGKESYKLASYARIISLSRQTIINDDLGAFTRIPQLYGQKAAILEGDIVWALITANGNMADAKPIFDTAHSNYTSSGTAISVDSIGVGAVAMAKQTGLEGDPLSLMPSFIAYPVGKMVLVEKLLAPITIALTVTSGTPGVEGVPGFVRGLTPIREPRLDKASATAWYMFANPNTVDTIEYCYLAGQEGMYFESKVGFEVDGVQFKARHDFGAGVVDYRGLYKNVGA